MVNDMFTASINNVPSSLMSPSYTCSDHFTISCGNAAESERKKWQRKFLELLDDADFRAEVLAKLLQDAADPSYPRG